MPLLPLITPSCPLPPAQVSEYAVGFYQIDIAMQLPLVRGITPAYEWSAAVGGSEYMYWCEENSLTHPCTPGERLPTSYFLLSGSLLKAVTRHETQPQINQNITVNSNSIVCNRTVNIIVICL